MNYTAKSGDKILLFFLRDTKDSVSGYFSYSSNNGSYISGNIIATDKQALMKRLLFTSTQEIMKCYGENIESLTSKIWDKFFYEQKSLKLNSNSQN